MLRPVVAVADARRIAGARQAVTGPVDAPAVFARRDGYVTNWNDEEQANSLRVMTETAWDRTAALAPWIEATTLDAAQRTRRPPASHLS